MAIDISSQSSSVTLISPDRLSKIDHLREKNIGKLMPLPQLVAVGGQSSGKSSLLESLTGIPFPHDQELCTRYATQISSRREELPRISISIIPNPSASQVDKDRLESYHKQVETTAQLYEEFPAILNEVNTLMGIRTSRNPHGDKTFTQDVLKIEKCGPNEDCLTVIDVPGIFRTTDETTTTQDRDLVDDMVRSYIRDSRTVILAVLLSNVDVAAQGILTLAEEYDKTGERTLGILTKPDLCRGLNEILPICKLVEGTERPLKLGCYVVRNRGGDNSNQIGGSSQEKREDMFQQEPWCQLPSHRLGVAALREALQELLGQITDKVFSKLRAETRQLLKKSQDELEGLGRSRQTEREQQQYLVAMASKFQSFARAALNADYSAYRDFTNNELRLITAVINITDQFNDDFKSASHAYAFPGDTTEDSTTNYPTGESVNMGFNSDNHYHEVFPGRDEFPDLDQITVPCIAIEQPKGGIMDWIKDMHHRSRGLELGTFSSGLLSSAFLEQSIKWESMAKHYLGKIIFIIHRFIIRALGLVCTDEMVRQKITSNILSDLLAKYEDGMKQAMFLVDVERAKKPYTLNHYFNDNLQKSRGVRLEETLRDLARQEDSHYVTSELIVELDSIPLAVTHQSNAEHAIEDIHDVLEAYYKVARKRFVDSVFHQAVDHCLLSGPMSPLTVFSEQWVLQLDTEQLVAIAGESRITQERRERLKKTIQDMEEAIGILR